MSNPNTPPDTKSPHRDRRPVEASLARHSRWSVALAPLLLVMLGLAACGGGSSNNTPTTSTGSTDTMARAVQASQCMRAHGVTNFPDPRTAGPGAKNGLDPNSPTFRAAQTACRQYFPPGAPTPPAQSAQREAQLLRFAQCMRSHGVPNFPDPNGQGDFNFAGTGINPDLNSNSPQFQASAATCASQTGLIHGGSSNAPPAP
jgi:hypothetical protein